MKICLHCSEPFERTEKRGKQFYCSPKCAYEVKIIYNAMTYGKNAVYHRKYRKRKKEDKQIPKPELEKMPDSKYNCDNFDWDMIDNLTNSGGKYG